MCVEFKGVVFVIQMFKEYINRVQDIFASHLNSSIYSTSSHGDINESDYTGNVKDGASSKVPNSLSKPERQSLAVQTR